MEFFLDEVSYFVILSSLAYMEPTEKKSNIKENRKYKYKNRIKITCKNQSKVKKYKNNNKIKSNCKNQNKAGLPPNKR